MEGNKNWAEGGDELHSQQKRILGAMWYDAPPDPEFPKLELEWGHVDQPTCEAAIGRIHNVGLAKFSSVAICK